VIEKSFYSCLDPYVVAPQAEQHKLIASLAESLSGKVVFYGAEDYFVAPSQPFILSKLKRTPGLDGVLFFTIDQFSYSNDLNISLLADILDLGLMIGFARENLILQSGQCLQSRFLEMRAYAHCKRNRAAHLLLS
jgi:hypothetical protein